MAVFFNGQLLVTPTTASVVNDDAMRNQNLSVGNVLAIVGRAAGGEPKKALRFGNPIEAKRALRGGEGLEAVLKAFAPSSETGGPQQIVFVRVNPATQAGLTLKDASDNDVIDLVSSNFGLADNQIKIRIENGSLHGKRITTQYGAEYSARDNVGRAAFEVEYTGSESTATITVTGTTVELAVAGGSPANVTIQLSDFPTVETLVDRINSVPDFSASVMDRSQTSPTVNGLDFVAAVDLTNGPVEMRADLQAVIEWLNGAGEGFVTATRAAGAGAPPANIPFTFLAGGSDGNVTNIDWSDAFDALQSIDVQWITPISGDDAIRAMADTHVQFCSNQLRRERRAIVGTAAGVSDDDALFAARILNSDRTSVVHIGHYDYDDSGKLVLFPPYQTAAMIAGAFSGVNPGTPLTNKSLRVRGLERDLLNPTETDRLITGGVLCVENTEAGYKVVKSISTWLVNDNYNRVEQSTGFALDFVARNVRNALDVLRGSKGNELVLSRAISIADTTLRELARQEPQGPGVLAGNAESPAYRNIQASLEGDVLRVEFECSPVIPVNYVLVTIFAVPFTGTATA